MNRKDFIKSLIALPGIGKIAQKLTAKTMADELIDDVKNACIELDVAELQKFHDAEHIKEANSVWIQTLNSYQRHRINAIGILPPEDVIEPPTIKPVKFDE